MPEVAEGTNFDLWLDLGAHGQVFVEVKLTENGFGTAKSNTRRLKKLEEIYRPRLTGKAAPEALEADVFFSRYQLLRNLSYVDLEAYAPSASPPTGLVSRTLGPCLVNSLSSGANVSLSGVLPSLRVTWSVTVPAFAS